MFPRRVKLPLIPRPRERASNQVGGSRMKASSSFFGGTMAREEQLMMENPALAPIDFPNDSNSSGVSWGAVIAGTFVAAALSLALLALGTGVGFSSVSPWANSGASAAKVSSGAIIWFVLMQLIAFSIGGYLAGRLRTKWVNVH